MAGSAVQAAVLVHLCLQYFEACALQFEVVGAKLGRVAQLQMRDVSGQLESRVQLLNIKSSNKVNWVSLAVAHRMAGNYELAWQVKPCFGPRGRIGNPGFL